MYSILRVILLSIHYFIREVVCDSPGPPGPLFSRWKSQRPSLCSASCPRMWRACHWPTGSYHWADPAWWMSYIVIWIITRDQQFLTSWQMPMFLNEQSRIQRYLLHVDRFKVYKDIINPLGMLCLTCPRSSWCCPLGAWSSCWGWAPRCQSPRLPSAPPCSALCKQRRLH